MQCLSYDHYKVYISICMQGYPQHKPILILRPCFIGQHTCRYSVQSAHGGDRPSRAGRSSGTNCFTTLETCFLINIDSSIVWPVLCSKQCLNHHHQLHLQRKGSQIKAIAPFRYLVYVRVMSVVMASKGRPKTKNRLFLNR